LIFSNEQKIAVNSVSGLWGQVELVVDCDSYVRCRVSTVSWMSRVSRVGIH
jgi:hypothetical protein